jgi:hypothetical protein
MVYRPKYLILEERAVTEMTHRLNLGPKTVDHSLPFNGWPAKINQETEALARGAQVVQALGGMLARQAFDAFQLDHQYVFDKDVGIVFSDVLAFVRNRKSSLRDGFDTADAEFFQ